VVELRLLPGQKMPSVRKLIPYAIHCAPAGESHKQLALAVHLCRGGDVQVKRQHVMATAKMPSLSAASRSTLRP